MAAYKINERVIDIDDLSQGTIIAINNKKITILFDDQIEATFDHDDEWIMSAKDWERAGRELRADERAERLYFAMDA